MHHKHRGYAPATTISLYDLLSHSVSSAVGKGSAKTAIPRSESTLRLKVNTGTTISLYDLLSHSVSSAVGNKKNPDLQPPEVGRDVLFLFTAFSTTLILGPSFMDMLLTAL